jgi:hypothetical protein
MPNILLTIGLIALVLALILGIAESIWDRVENDIAKENGYDKIYG